jgi:NAD(P)H-hydrate repair Nnr-like enzyme with NAD(P)H-hydrate epimerase domain
MVVSKRQRASTERDLELKAAPAIEKVDTMKITKNIGMILLAVYLIVDGLLGFGLNLGPAIFLL